MPRRDFRAHATQICHHLVVEGGLVDRSTSGCESIPLANSWPLVCSSVANATQSNPSERNLGLLKSLLRAGVIPRLFSIVLDYPAPPPCDKPSEVSCDCGGVLVDLDVRSISQERYALLHSSPVLNCHYLRLLYGTDLSGRCRPSELSSL